jgi:hypothetical protein
MASTRRSSSTGRRRRATLLPSDWLSQREGWSFYPEAVLDGLRPYGIGYRDGMFTSLLTFGFPYLTFGRTTEVPLRSEREIMADAQRMGLSVVFEKHGNDLHAWGFEIVTSVWMVVRPVTVARPPSTYEQDPAVKARLDLEAIRRYGY